MPYADPAERAENSRRYYRDVYKARLDPKRILANTRRWQEKQGPDYVREAWLKTKYRMTLTEWDEMFLRQNGVCRICKKPPTGTAHNQRLHVDHDHATGQVRALLCHRCNKSLGLMFDDPALLRAAADYLESR